MAAPRWLAIFPSVLVAAAAFASCSDQASTTGTGGGSSTSSTTTTSTTTTTTTGTGGEDAGPAAPVCNNKSYSNIPKGECDLFNQDCGPGETCKPAPSGNTFTTKCFPSYGLKSEGETCYVDDECLPKLQCIGDHCSPICCSSNVPCASGRCGLQLGLNATLFMQACIYSTACELFTEGSCPPGFLCQVDPVQGLPTCIQPSGSPSPELGACSFLNDCGDQQQCIFPSGKNKGVCHYLCYLKQMSPTPAGEGGCPDGEVCQNHDGPTTLPFDIENIGICVPTGAKPDAGAPDGAPDADMTDADMPDADMTDGAPDADVPDADMPDGM
ncbi:MAG: hypothetical protein U0359_08760 [Byssovorax sp.]